MPQLYYPTPPPSANHWSPPQKPFDPNHSSAAFSYYEPSPQPTSYPLPQSRPQSPYQSSPPPMSYLTQDNDYYQSSPRPQSPYINPSKAQPSYPTKRPSYTRTRPASYPPPRSPLPHRVPSPYSPYKASRPLPRPGLRKRIWAKLRAYVHALADWVRSHPVTAGLSALLPLLAGLGVYKVAKGVASLFGTSLAEVEGEVKDKAKEQVGSIWRWGEVLLGVGEMREWWFDEFKGFGGTKVKDGALVGFLKMLQIAVTHWCRLTSSSVPRTMSILLELYFLNAVVKGVEKS